MNGTRNQTNSPSRRDKTVVAVLSGRKLMGFQVEGKIRITEAQISEAVRLKSIHRLSVELLVRSMRINGEQAALLMKAVQ